MTQRDHWHAFDGWAAARNVDPLTLPLARFLNLVHHYILLSTDPEEQNRINQLLVGPSRINAPTLVDKQSGFTPPAWWKGDDYASRSAMLAGVMLKRK